MSISSKFLFLETRFITLLIGFLFIGSNIVKAQNFDYLIITPAAFSPQNETWDDELITLQTSRGYHPLLITIQDGVNRDDIKQTITTYYQNNPIKYVLLVGSAKDGPPQAPRDTSILDLYRDHGTIKAAADFVNGNYIPFFAVESNNPWNPPRSYVATDDPYISDLTSHGQVYIGRIPVISVTEAEDYVAKLQNYYNHSPAYLAALNNEIIITTNIDHPTNGCTGTMVDRIINNLKEEHISSSTDVTLLNVSDFNYDCYYFDERYPCEDSENHFTDLLNPGASIISSMSTGGGPQILAGWFWENGDYNFTNKNTAMPFLVAAGCNMGEVNYYNVESSMRKLMTYYNGGIIGAIAPTNTSEQHANGYLLNRFNDLIKIDNSLPLGEIFRTLKMEIAANFPIFEFYYNSLVFFGDPSMLSSLYKHRSGSISASTTWNGNIVIDNSVALASGRTLTIKPGTKIYFKNGSAITINGTLNAVGTSSQKILFNSDGITNSGLITFNGTGSSNSVLDYVEVRNRSGIQCMNGADITIQNSRIELCTNGIYIYNSEPLVISNTIQNPSINGIYGEASGKYPLIKGNTIIKTTNHQYQGIYLLNQSLPFITANDIQGFAYGLYIGGGGYTYFMDNNYVTPSQNNRFYDNIVGIGSAWGSYVFACENRGRDCNNNSIYTNSSYDASAYQSGTIYAGYNYWGTDGAQLYQDGTSYIDASNPLSSDPWPPIIPHDEKLVTPVQNNNPRANGNDDIFECIDLERQNRTTELIQLCKQMLTQNSNADFALVELVKVKRKFHINGIKEYLDSLLSGNRPFRARVLDHLANIALDENKYNVANQIFNLILQQYPNTPIAINVMFEKFFAALNIIENRELAGQFLSDLQSLEINDNDFLMRLHMAETLYNQSGNSHMSKPTNSHDEINEVMEYALFNNFPNPFNPSTTINYQLPQNGLVTLKVYDILGKEVATLVNEQKIQGSYSANFDASKLASGVYIYQLRVNDFVSSKKMLLLK